MAGRRPDVGREELLGILEHLEELVVLVDPDWTIRYLNRMDEEGGPDLIGADALEMVLPEYREEQAERFERVMETGEPEGYEVPVTEPDGRVGWYAGIVRRFSLGDGATWMMFTNRDVTEEHRGKAALDVLRRLVPVCSWCGRIQAKDGTWETLERYVEDEEGSRVTHGVCPSCADELESNGKSA